MATLFVDFNGGLDTNTGVSFLQRVKTLTKAATLAVAGDVIRVMGKAATTSGTATWTKNSPSITLSAAMNQLLYGDGAWTAAANVTATTNTTAPTPKQGSNSCKLVCAAGFTTGLVAFFPTGTLNLSAYQQITFWIQSTTALASGSLSVNLCSDAAGVTIVNTMALNVALNANQWTAVTLNNAANLGASIASIRLTANTSMASKTIFIDNVSACKSTASPDLLTLNTLVSNDSGATFYHVQSINGTAVNIDGQATTAAGLAKGYQGATGSSTLTLLQPTQVSIGTGNTVYAQVFSGNGSLGSPITISGGWDSAAMTSQSGWTSIDMQDWSGSGINLTGATGFITVDKFNFSHCAFPLGLVANSKGYTLSNGSCAGTGSFSNMPTRGMTLTAFNFLNASGTTAIINIPQTANFNADQVNYKITNSKINGCTVGGIKVPNNIGSPGVEISGCSASGNGGIGFDIQSICNKFFSNSAINNAAPGFNFQGVNGVVGYGLLAQGNVAGEIQISGSDAEIYGLDTNTPSGSAVPQVFFPSAASGQATIYNWTQYTGGAPAAVLTSLGNPAAGRTAGNYVASQKEGGVPANNSLFTDYGKITTTGIVGQPGTGIGWQLSPNVNAFAGSPLRLNVGKFACPANVPTTIKYYAKFSAAGPSGQFRIFGGRYAGVGSAGTDVTVAVSGTAWTQYTLTFTPTEICVVDVYFETWGSSTQSASVSGPIVVNQ